MRCYGKKGCIWRLGYFLIGIWQEIDMFDDRFMACLPPSLSCKAFVEESEDFGDVKLHIFEVEILLTIFLHLEEVVELQIQL